MSIVGSVFAGKAPGVRNMEETIERNNAENKTNIDKIYGNVGNSGSSTDKIYGNVGRSVSSTDKIYGNIGKSNTRIDKIYGNVGKGGLKMKGGISGFDKNMKNIIGLNTGKK